MFRLTLPAILLLALMPLAASAEMYRCLKDGTAVFSDKPCDEAAQAYTPKPIQVVPSVKGANLAKQYDERTAKEAKERDQANEAWNKDHEVQKKKEETIRDARIDGKVVNGMNQEQVISTLGKPQVTSHNENLGVVREGWTYKYPDGSRTIVYFKDGIVTGTSLKQGK